MAGLVPLDIADDNHSPAQQAEAEHAALTVVEAVILDFVHRPLEYLGGIQKIEPAFIEGPGPLHRVAGDFHRIIVVTFYVVTNEFPSPQKWPRSRMPGTCVRPHASLGGATPAEYPASFPPQPS